MYLQGTGFSRKVLKDHEWFVRLHSPVETPSLKVFPCGVPKGTPQSS